MKPFNVYPLFDINPVKGEGCYIFDDQNNKYLDLYGGHAVISIGHSHPVYIDAITKQLQKIGFYSNAVQNKLQNKLAEKIGRMADCSEYELFLCNTGAEANENALKLASFKNKRTKIITFNHGFHGRTAAAVNVTDNEKIKAPLNKGFEVEFHDFNQIDTVVKSLANQDVCAVIIEGIQGIGGIHVADPGFLQQLSAACEKFGTFLIMDEVQAGFGRTGTFFSFQQSSIQPDLITMAKGMGNGFPIGGVLIHPKFKATYGLLGSTFGGNYLACTAALAVLEVIEKERLMDQAKEKGAYFNQQLQTLPNIQEVRGKGLMIGIEFDFPIAKLRKQLLYEEKIFTGASSNKYVMRLLPPLNIGKYEIDLFIEKLSKIMALWKLAI